MWGCYRKSRDHTARDRKWRQSRDRKTRDRSPVQKYVLRMRNRLRNIALVGPFHRKWQSRQTGSRNLMGPKTLPTIWCTYMKLVTKYQISTINSCWEKCDEKCAYMFNVYKNQLSRQTGSRNLTGPKMLPTIWYTYMTLVTKYQISAINSYWEKCDEKYFGRTNRRTEVKQYTPSPFGERGYKNTFHWNVLYMHMYVVFVIYNDFMNMS